MPRHWICSSITSSGTRASVNSSSNNNIGPLTVGWKEVNQEKGKADGKEREEEAKGGLQEDNGEGTCGRKKAVKRE